MPQGQGSDLSDLQNKADLSDLAAKANVNDTGGNIEASEPDKPWYSDAYDALTGGGLGAVKRLGTIATTPSRILSDLRVPGFKGQNYDYLKEKTDSEKFGGNLVGAASYITPVGAEAQAARLLTPSMRAIPYVGRALNAFAKGALGASTNAAVAYANKEDPKTAALVGGSVPVAGELAEPLLGPVSQWIKQSARNSMARALDPGSAVNKWISQKILDPLLANKNVFWSLRGLEKSAQSKMDEAVAMKAGARAQMPADASIPQPQVDTAMKEAANRFLPIENPAAPGARYTATKSDEAALTELQALQNKMTNANIPAQTPGAYPFDLAESFKQEWQDFAKLHGKYTGKKTVGMDPEMSPYIEALDSGGTQLRKLLESNAPADWARANQLYHTWRQIKDIATERAVLKSGSKLPLSERMVGGFGAGMTKNFSSPIQGAEIRAYRRLVDSPGYNSTIAVMKDLIGNKLGLPKEGFGAGAAASFMLGEDQDSTGTVDTSNINASPVQGQKANMSQGQTMPATVTLMAPDGSVKEVAPDEVQHYISLGAKPVVK